MAGAPRIKFCGITRLIDAQRAAEAGAWAIGMILWPGSARAADPAEAERIARLLRRQVEIAGVFVNQPLDDVAAMVDTIGLSIVQLHGDEGPAYVDEVQRRTGARVIKAVAVAAPEDVQAIEVFRRADFHLLDAHHPDLRGGTGQTFEWDLLSHRHSKVPLILSGGLTAENVGDAIARVHPYAVDVASGTEREPGVKDHHRIEAFAAAVRASAEVSAA